MKQILASVAVLLSTLTAGAEERSLFITFSDNTKAEYKLSTLPEITMENDKLSITTTATTAEFDLYKVKTFTFSTSTGIETIEKQGFSLNGNAIVLDGESSKVRIFSIDGKAVPAKPIIYGDKTIVNLNSLDRGVYIVSANGKSVKITRR